MQTEWRSEGGETIAAPTHIIERPRLIKLMEESGARVIVLNAPAGYGKTTLARQWATREDRRTAWYRCSAASSDVAVLVQGISEAVGKLVPGAGSKTLARLRASGQPDEEAGLLGELLAEDLRECPPDAWLVVDDYHLLSDSQAVGRFAERVLDAQALHIVVATRARPPWATARRIIYGEVLEVDRSALAMHDGEASSVLSQYGDEAVASVLERARGWPVVIGLAALAPGTIARDVDLPPRLYDFFAEELYQASSNATRLSELALISGVTREIASSVFGVDDAAALLEEAFQLGIATQSIEGEPELHPLLRSFLRTKLVSSPGGRGSARAVASALIAHGYWEHAFGLLEDFALPELLPPLVEAGLEQGLSSGRVATVRNWLRFAEEHTVEDPTTDLAAAEIAFREGQYLQAETLATRAAESLSDSSRLRFPALIRAAQGALQANRLEASYRLATEAAQAAQSDIDRREARISQLFAALELEIDETMDLAGALDRQTDRSLDGLLRTASARLIVASRIGGLEEVLNDCEPAIHLISKSSDPIARGSFLSALAHAFALTARYSRAIEVASQEIEVATTYRLDFARYHGLAAQAIAHLGAGNLTRAQAAIAEIRSYGEELGDDYFVFYSLALDARRLVIKGDHAAAIEATRPLPPSNLSRTMQGEYFAYRSIALACIGDHEATRIAVDRAETASRWGVEARVLAAGARAVSTLFDGHGDQPVRRVLELVHSTGNADGLISLCLAHPPFLERALEVDEEAVPLLLARTGNRRLLGHPALKGFFPITYGLELLTPRERQVHSLVVGGRTNAEIARALFLSEKTVKVHVRHIFDKVGVRSRVALVLRSQEDASTQPAEDQ
jgi:LuxR family transcriptional regulator, maltose regulon positive regulatory protein